MCQAVHPGLGLQKWPGQDASYQGVYSQGMEERVKKTTHNHVTDSAMEVLGQVSTKYKYVFGRHWGWDTHLIVTITLRVRKSCPSRGNFEVHTAGQRRIKAEISSVRLQSPSSFNVICPYNLLQITKEGIGFQTNDLSTWEGWVQDRGSQREKKTSIKIK